MVNDTEIRQTITVSTWLVKIILITILINGLNLLSLVIEQVNVC